MCSTYGVARKVIKSDPQLDSAQILVELFTTGIAD
jgi:hypothetical protein